MKKLVWGALFYNLLVIVWGAYVRASGSGAGCGSHWPLCNGEIIPRTGLIETSIEYIHRVTSGVCLIIAAVIAWKGRREYQKGNPIRTGANAILIFTLMEAAIGAGLVLFNYTNKDQSVGRVVSISLHLFNTFLLLAALSLTAWWTSASAASPRYRLERKDRRDPKIWRVTILSLVATGLLGVTGAITALGDTLFRSPSLAHGLQQDFLTTSHFLVKLRVIHPVLAVLTGAWLFYFAEFATDRRPGPDTARLSLLLKALVGSQLALGLANLLLLAPTGLQLAHLLLAECVWIVLVLLAALSLQAKQDLHV